jgi:hypothetical protein
LNKKRREADVLRCVRRFQCGRERFRATRIIDRFLWHEPFDDAQLTALSNALRAKQLGGRQRRRQRRRTRSAQAQGRARRLRFVAPPPSLASPHPSRPHRRRRRPPPSPLPRAARRLFRVTPPSSTTSRAMAAAVSPRCPCVRSSTSPITELAAAGKQADLETERLRLKALAAKSVVELAREKTPPPPPPPLKQ